jgi:transketolase
MAASFHKVGNLVGIIDRNRIQNDDFVEKQMDPMPLAEKYRAFGWAVRDGLDGHDFAQIEDGLRWARDVQGQPACVIFETTKGKGVSFMENNPGFHGAAPNADQYAAAMRELGAEA